MSLIGIDYRVFQTGYAQRGIGRYVWGLLDKLFELDNKNSFKLLIHENVEISDQGLSERYRHKIEYLKIKKPSSHEWVWENTILPCKLFFSKVDLFLATVCLGPIRAIELPLWQPLKTIGIVYDLHIEKINYDPLMVAYRRMKSYRVQKKAIRKCAIIITISDAVKHDINERLSVNSAQIEVIYPGLNKQVFKPGAGKDEVAAYVVMVGDSPNKNIKNGLAAFHIVKKKYPGLSLKILGEQKVILAGLDEPIDLNNVEFLERKSDEALCDLYQKAKLLLFPSFNEGFGMPPLEAMACGCPVIVSDIPVLREVVGDEALFVDPQQAQNIADIMQQCLADKSLRECLIKNGLARVQQFDWGKSAGKLLQTIANCAHM